MADYRSMFDKEYLGAWDLVKGKNIVLVIERVEAKELNNGKNKNRKPVVYFRGKTKGMAINATNGKAIAGMYGTDTVSWIGKPIAVYATTTTFGHDTVDCLRVRPQVPQMQQQAKAASGGHLRALLPPEGFQGPVPDEREPGDDGDEETGELPMTDEDRAAAIDRGEA